MRRTWFVEDLDNDEEGRLIFDFDRDRVHLQVRQPGWPGLIDSFLMNDIWHEIVSDVADIHPSLAPRRVFASAKPFQCLLYRLNPQWQSVANLLFMIGASGMSEHRTDLIAAWRRQPPAIRAQSWLRNCGDPAMAAAQLLATIKTPSPVIQTAISPWVSKVIGCSHAREEAVSSWITKWIHADTPLGVTCAPHMELVEDSVFLFASPVLTECNVWLGAEYLHSRTVAQASLEFLQDLVEDARESGWHPTGHEALDIARDLERFRRSTDDKPNKP